MEDNCQFRTIPILSALSYAVSGHYITSRNSGAFFVRQLLQQVPLVGTLNFGGCTEDANMEHKTTCRWGLWCVILFQKTVYSALT